MIERRIDELGRIVVPKEMRNKLGITSGTPIQIECTNNEIVLKKAHDCCYLCGDRNDVDKELHICRTCMNKVLRASQKR